MSPMLKSHNDVSCTLDTQITIDVAHDVRVLDGTNNGTWYGIPPDEVEKCTNFVAKSGFGIVINMLRVNEQGVGASRPQTVLR